MRDIVETPEQIAKHYSAAMDSVNLVNVLKAKPSLNESETKRLQANISHLRIMLTRTFWTTEDLTPLQNAVI